MPTQYFFECLASGTRADPAAAQSASYVWLATQRRVPCPILPSGTRHWQPGQPNSQQTDKTSMRDERPSTNEQDVWLNTAAPSLTSFASDEHTGKWCIFRAEHEIDESWTTIKALAAQEKILIAKVSTAIGRRYHDGHVICIYTRNWNDRADLMTVRDVLRAAGFTEELGYKRDIDTMRRVYGPDEWYVRA